ncbi:MAG: hypothetical protein CAPSK01_001974 [Candidatus Accumulibacter vicinus]|uniref:Uncharacterized protein n=1 Tax=Candidatus Accumulibacter vicinus TaxID=2954382 RepID=A0A084Y078_9PROT|nr:MAG: hypothetical protein CAPSK01_001974 [Candidatus Accumulibacter vicinus]
MPALAVHIQARPQLAKADQSRALIRPAYGLCDFGACPAAGLRRRVVEVVGAVAAAQRDFLLSGGKTQPFAGAEHAIRPRRPCGAVGRLDGDAGVDAPNDETRRIGGDCRQRPDCTNEQQSGNRSWSEHGFSPKVSEVGG